MHEDILQQILAFFSGLLTPTIGLITTYIAYQQYKTNKIRLNLERYDRRLGVYAEIRKILTSILIDANISDQALFRFKSATAQADFLFGKEIPAYIDEIYRRGLKILEVNAELQDRSLSQDKRKRIISEKFGAIKWMTGQSDLISDKFKKYLDLSG